MTLGEFEALVLSQKPASKPWQATEAVPYDFASRRAAEGIHPQLIVDVFQPLRVLDVGCGPGHLVAMLRGLGVNATGCDLGEPGDHPCFFQMDITMSRRPFSRYWDLVICREVCEHLTLLQIRKAITNLCELSSKFVYVTTRFSSEHDMFRVETEDTLDPTHITIASKDLYRLLFTLEGFKQRSDLEQRMDWKNLGRCLVYERAV